MGYSEWFEGLRAASGDARSRLLVGLIAAQFVVEGALDVLLVVIAIRVLEESQGWVGYLNTAYGIGGVVAGILTARLIWGRLGHLIGFAVAVLGVSLALTAFSHIAVLTLVLLAAVGAGRAVLSVSVNTLLQRVVPVHVLGRVFGLVEGLSNAGLALGAALAPLLINLGGYRIAVVTVGFLLPVVVVIGINTLRRLDDGVRVPVVEVALLRSLPHFAELPVTALETLAESADHVEAGPGAVIIRQGEQGDRFYAIVDGNVTVSVDGRLRNSMSRGQGIGEIALLRCSPRTATVTAVDSVSLLALESASFLAALSGHAPTRRRVDDVAQRLNSADVIDLR
ncbi:MAG TPA: cyclic nucleotide-binding domain-containing protein [Acidimicrobiales bacterium]|nr:cyclic nucleotide-binding domain-containing protein [Acidimicrobiales bacterium]